MIVLQVISLLVLVFIVVIIYAATVRLVDEYRQLQNTKDQDNLDLTNKQ